MTDAAETIIATIRLNSHQHVLRIVLYPYNEQTYVGLREYREFKEGDWRPSKGGVCFPLKRLPVTIRSLLKAYEKGGRVAGR